MLPVDEKHHAPGTLNRDVIFSSGTHRDGIRKIRRGYEGLETARLIRGAAQSSYETMQRCQHLIHFVYGDAGTTMLTPSEVAAPCKQSCLDATRQPTASAGH